MKKNSHKSPINVKTDLQKSPIDVKRGLQKRPLYRNNREPQKSSMYEKGDVLLCLFLSERARARENNPEGIGRNVLHAMYCRTQSYIIHIQFLKM